MKEDMVAHLVLAESEYHDVIKAAVKEAERYEHDRKEEQLAYAERLKHEWHEFERAENKKLELQLFIDNEKMEKEAERLKGQMRVLRKENAGQISTRLKEEVLSLIWQ